MKYSVYSASEWVFPDAECSGAHSVALHSARNANTGFQLKLTDIPEHTPISVSHPFGSPLVLEAYRLVDVMVEKNTGRVGFTWSESDGEPEYVTRRAPFRVYDPIRPYRNGKEFAGAEASAFYFCFHIPQSVVPGDYAEEITVTAGDESITVPVTVRVYRAEVPPMETLDVTNWFSVGNMARSHKAEPWSEEHWEIIRRYGALMRRARQNTFWVTRDLTQVSKDENGNYCFDFSRAKRLIEMYLDMGFTVIEGTQVAYRQGWNSEVFHLWDGERELQATSIDGYAYLSRYLTAWRNFLEENGWYDLLIQHVADEPHDKCKNDYFRLSSIVRQYLPGVEIIEAVEIPDLAGAVDIWVPKDHYYESHKEQYEAFRAAGNTIWFYTCCFPGGHFMNRLLDKPLIEVRYLHWGNFKYRMPGFLHWGLNHYYDFQDPFENTTPLHDKVNIKYLPAGDSHLVYPGDDGPWSSMRLENHCFGAQDYELFSILAGKDEAEAQSLCDSMVRAFDDFEKDPAVMEETRIRLLEALN